MLAATFTVHVWGMSVSTQVSDKQTGVTKSSTARQTNCAASYASLLEWWFHALGKYAQVKLYHFSPDRGERKKEKPPARIRCW